MAAIQWVYANGSNWVVLDKDTQCNIEMLWKNNASNWVSSQSFREPVYVDISQMALICNNYAYSIARRRV